MNRTRSSEQPEQHPRGIMVYRPWHFKNGRVIDPGGYTKEYEDLLNRLARRSEGGGDSEQRP